MRGLPPKTLPLRVAVQADASLVNALAEASEHMLLNPVETNLEIAARVTLADVLVVDVARAPHVGLEEIRNLQIDRPVLALVRRGHEREAILAGAQGAVARERPPAYIAAAIQAVGQGLAVLEPAVLRELAGPTRDSSGAEREISPAHGPVVLTPREGEVIALLAEGLSNKEIAAQLRISEHTAKFHVNSILQKLDSQKRVEAVVRAAQLGIIDL